MVIQNVKIFEEEQNLNINITYSHLFNTTLYYFHDIFGVTVIEAHVQLARRSPTECASNRRLHNIQRSPSQYSRTTKWIKIGKGLIFFFYYRITTNQSFCSESTLQSVQCGDILFDWYNFLLCFVYQIL